jgi:hypothetical protein
MLFPSRFGRYEMDVSARSCLYLCVAGVFVMSFLLSYILDRDIGWPYRAASSGPL